MNLHLLDVPLITCVETGLRQEDLELQINKLNNKIEQKINEQPLAVQRLDNIEMSMNNLNNQIAKQDEIIDITKPAAPVVNFKHKTQKRK